MERSTSEQERSRRSSMPNEDIETITDEDDEAKSQLDDVDEVDVDESGAELEIGDDEDG